MTIDELLVQLDADLAAFKAARLANLPSVAQTMLCNLVHDVAQIEKLFHEGN